MASQEDEQNPGWAARVLPPAVGGAVGAAGGGLLAFDPKAAKKHEAIVEKLKALAKGGGTEAEALEEAQKILGKSERLEQPVKDLFAHYAGHAQHKANAEKARELSTTAQKAAKTAKRALGEKIMDSDIAGAIEDAVTQPVNRAHSQPELRRIAREVIGASPVVKDGGSVHRAAQELFKLQDALKANNITAASRGEAETRFTSLLQNIPQEKQQAVGDYLMSGDRSQEAKEVLLNRTGLEEELYQPVEDAYDKVLGIHPHIQPIEELKNNFTTSLSRHLGSESPVLGRLAEEVEPFAASTRTGNSRWNDFKARFEEALLPDAQEFATHKHQESFQKAEWLRLNEAAADMSLKTPELEGALEKALHTRGSLSKGGACGVVAATALAGIGLGLGAAHLLNNSHAHKELERTAAREGAQATIS